MKADLTFYERGVVDALGMLHEVGALTENELKALLSAYPYHLLRSEAEGKA
jgi:predicted ATPase